MEQLLELIWLLPSGQGLLPRRLAAARDDAAKFLRHGRGFPRRMERIWVDPMAVRRAIAHPIEIGLTPSHARYDPLARAFRAARDARGRIVPEAQFRTYEQVNLRDLVKIRCCVRHWRDGVPWAETGIYDHLMRKIEVFETPQSGCATIEDVRRRYARLDRTFETVAREGRLRSQRELRPGLRRELDGIEMHIGPDGRAIFGDKGNHRLAMALALGLRRAPAMLGFVHRDGMGRLADHRRP